MFREDLLKKMQRHAVISPIVTATASATATANSDEVDDNFDDDYESGSGSGSRYAHDKDKEGNRRLDNERHYEDIAHGDITGQLVQTIIDQVFDEFLHIALIKITYSSIIESNRIESLPTLHLTFATPTFHIRIRI